MNLKDKIIAFDIDGTLANKTGTPSQYTIDIVSKLVEEGYTIILSTGRGVPSSQTIYDLLKLNTYCVYCNGALVYNPSTKEVLKGKPIPKQLIKDFLANEMALSLIKDASFLTKEEMYSLNGTVETRDGKKVKPFDLKKILSEDVYNIDVIANNKEDQKQLQNILTTLHPDYAYYYWVYFGEIRNINYDKVDGLKEVLKYYNKTSQDLIYFGDNEIDIHALRFAKYSIAMINANDDVKQAAKEITKIHHDEDGAIKHLLEMLDK